jgi:hypothetical protein
MGAELRDRTPQYIIAVNKQWTFVVIVMLIFVIFARQVLT